MTGRDRRGPVILDLEETPLPDAPSPAEAPPVEDAAPAAEQALHRAARGGGWGLGGVTAAALGGLVALALGLWVVEFVEGLFARTPWLGAVGLALAGVAALGLVLGAIGEAAALARLGRIETIRALAASARDSGARGPAETVLDALAKLYRGRPEMAAPAAEAARLREEIPDGPDLLSETERLMLPALDAQAERAVTAGVRRVAATTALLPMPAVDVAVILWSNARMIRRIAEIYGGRAGWLGSWRLLKAVAGHLVASGAVSATDDLLGPMLGGGVLGKLSRRFGEAAVNGALTARVGVAAMQVCRPLPFEARPTPRARAILMSAIGDWRGAKEGARG
mgnify:CR=1 FL=1